MANKLEAIVIAKTKAAEKNLQTLRKEVKAIGQENKKLGQAAAQAGKKAEDAYKKGEAAGKKLERQSKRTQQQMFGKSFFSGVGRMVTAYASIETAIRAATSALRHFNEEQEKAAQGTSVKRGGIGLLSQLAGGDETRFEELIKMTRDLRASFGYDFETASNLIFDLASYGREQEHKLFGLIGTGLGDPQKTAEAVQIFSKVFKDEGKSTKEWLDTFMTGAAKSGKVAFKDIGQYSAIAAPSMRESGGSATELIAIMSELVEQMKSPEEAATALRSLIKTVDESSLSGVGVMAVLPQLIKRQRLGTLKSDDIRGMLALNIIKDPSTTKEIRSMESDIQGIISSTRAGGTSPFDTTARMTANNREYKASLRSAIADQQYKMSLEDKLGTDRLSAQAAQDMTNKLLLDAGEGGLRRWWSDSVMGWTKMVGGTPEEVAAAGMTGNPLLKFGLESNPLIAMGTSREQMMALGLDKPDTDERALISARTTLSLKERQYQNSINDALLNDQATAVRIENIDELTAASDKSHLSNTESVK